MEESSSLLRLSQQLPDARKLSLHRHFLAMPKVIHKPAGKECLENLNVRTLRLDPLSADDPMKIVYAVV